MAEADDDFDLSRVEGVVSHWNGRAVLLLNPEMADNVAEDAASLRAGLSETWERDEERGGWVRVPGENDPDQERRFKPFTEAERRAVLA